ncbi:MAG: hypothetical protein FWF18_01680, partial [Dehalococcoidia bacterium]|nr:hypothetical protein [Dehalococcoidia bacterium]
MNKFAVAVSALLVASLCVISSCGPIKRDNLQDYYGEYTFTLPFDYTFVHWSGNVYFDTNYSMEQMAELVNEAGYNTSLHAIGNVKTILISAQKDGFTYYFVICDKNYPYSSNVYTLMSASASISIGASGNVPTDFPFDRPIPCRFLAPLHILESSSGMDLSDVRRVYGSFEDIAEFYRATGKDDFIIDDVNKTIRFGNRGNPA